MSKHLRSSFPESVPRVVLSIRHYVPDGGGAEVLAHRLAVELVKRGLPLEVLTGRYDRRRGTETLDGVPVRRHFIGAYVPVLHEICYLVSLAWQLVVRRKEYDIIHVFQTQLSAFLAAVVAKRMGKRVITTCHSAAPNTGDMAVWSYLPGGKQLLKYVSYKVDVATAVSNDITARLHQIGFSPERTWCIPNGVLVHSWADEDRPSLRARLGLNPESLVAVFVGRLAEPKKPELLLDAWTFVRQKYSNSQLVLVGDGEKKVMLEAKAMQMGLERAVVFAGQVRNVDEYLRTADIFVLPTTSEGMPLALLEAMAVGLPVIGSGVGGVVDVIKHGENGLLFEPHDITGLVNSLIFLMESPERRSEFGKKAVKTIRERFSLNVAVDRYMMLYKSLLTTV